GEKRFGCRSLTRQDKVRKAFVPFSLWHFGIGSKPVLQSVKINNRNPTFTEPLNKMVHEVRRRSLNFRHFRLGILVLLVKHDSLKLFDEATEFPVVFGVFDAFQTEMQ